ncbi:MAG TPA: RidA family protein [Candidatus Binatia bacterium]|jgi:enamine deaminase RidA (YjgF/YER057c/UK114 family)|nr:RidA family protein [Candidatus Binatia bacterium]
MAEDVRITITEGNGRTLASTGSAWEPKMGYSRAVRAGSAVAVTGTVGLEADGSFAPSLGAQTRRALTIIQAAIEALGGRIEDVVRTRIYVTDIARWQEVAEVHGAVFRDIRPATTIVQVARLIDDAALIEIEADAVLS